MRTYACLCGATLYFENTHCIACGRDVGWCEACRRMTAITAKGRCANSACGKLLIPCRNRTEHGVCNVYIASEQNGTDLCRSCQMTTHLPDLSLPENIGRWGRLEAAKRRLL